MKENDNPYIISGGEEGKKRLKVLSDVLEPYTRSLFEKSGSMKGKKVLDLGCGGGDVSLMVAKMVGKEGWVTGIDFDKEIIELAKQDAIKEALDNITFHALSAYDIEYENEFDIAYSRFLLSHLRDPLNVVHKMMKSLKPGGRIIVEDVQFSGHFSYPECKAFDSYLEYYIMSAKNKGQDPEIGPGLVNLLKTAGVEDIKFDIIQPAFNSGQGKWMAYITMDKIRESVINHGFSDAATIDLLLRELEAFTMDEDTIISMPRIFRVWGIK